MNIYKYLNENVTKEKAEKGLLKLSPKVISSCQKNFKNIEKWFKDIFKINEKYSKEEIYTADYNYFMDTEQKWIKNFEALEFSFKVLDKSKAFDHIEKHVDDIKISEKEKNKLMKSFTSIKKSMEYFYDKDRSFFSRGKVKRAQGIFDDYADAGLTIEDIEADVKSYENISSIFIAIAILCIIVGLMRSGKDIIKRAGLFPKLSLNPFKLIENILHWVGVSFKVAFMEQGLFGYIFLFSLTLSLIGFLYVYIVKRNLKMALVLSKMGDSMKDVSKLITKTLKFVK